MRYAIEIQTRSIAAALTSAVTGEDNWEARWRYYRFRWVAKLVVWYVNHLGAGPDYDRARFLGETL